MQVAILLLLTVITKAAAVAVQARCHQVVQAERELLHQFQVRQLHTVVVAVVVIVVLQPLRLAVQAAAERVLETTELLLL